MNDLVNIIITSYNHAEYLDQRIESILNQTYKSIEIIVVDDCSQDNSLDVLKKYEKYSNVTIVALKENLGYANACNIGVDLCKGEFVMFAECDDFNAPAHIEILMEKLIEKKSIGVAYCRSNIVDSQGTVLGNDFQHREKLFQKCCFQDTMIPQKEMQKYFLKSCVIPNMSAALIRKKYISMIGGFNSKYKACADWDFWCRLSRYCDFFYVTASLNNFRTHSSTVRNTMAISTSVLEIYDFLFREYMNVNLSIKEKLEFRISMGFVWAQYVAQSPINWLRNLPDIWLKSMKYDVLMFIYMCLAMVKKIFVFTSTWLFCKKI